MIDNWINGKIDNFKMAQMEKVYNFKVASVGNILQIATIAYVCFLALTAFLIMFQTGNKEKVYTRAFVATMIYITARLFGAVTLGVY